MILVVVMARGADRVAEALRAAVGLGLRDEPVESLLLVGADAASASDPRIARALGTLELLGRPARVVTVEEARAAAREARAVEVWTDPGAPRRIELGGGRPIDLASIDSRRLVEQIFQADGPVVLW